jgi:acyl-coenzyme A synthetase/AMP-(fatty) acid ligase
MPAPYTYDPTALKEVFEEHFTFIAGFRRNVHRYGARLALEDPAGDRRWTYAELGADVDRLAAGLAARGVEPRDVVAFQLFNSAEFALVYLASQRLGAIAAPVNFRFAPGETAAVLDDSRPGAYIFDEAVASDARTALALASNRPAVVAVVAPASNESDGGAGAAGWAVPFDELFDSGAVVPDGPPASTWEEATRLYTSGTTGRPKGVPLPALSEVLTAHDVIMGGPAPTTTCPWSMSTTTAWPSPTTSSPGTGARSAR